MTEAVNDGGRKRLKSSMTEAVHTPVLLEEVLQYLPPRSPEWLFLDATLGEGGHSLAFLSRFPLLRVIGIEADEVILGIARERLSEFQGRARFYSGWSQDFFAELSGDTEMPDAILIDLGVSVFHYEKSGRGFSFRKDEMLDMRIDPSRGQSAAGLIAALPEKDLAGLIFNYGEERYSRRIARAIVDARRGGVIDSSAALAGIVSRAVPVSRGRLHPATKTFQALRIAVNGELDRLPALLESALASLKPGGRMGVISFHSLEDRIVKNFFRGKNKNCTCPPDAPICSCRGRRVVNMVTRKAVTPGQAELRQNPPSRSAKLRVVEKITDEETN